MNGDVRWRWVIIPLLLFVLLPFAARRTAYGVVERNGLISRPVGPDAGNLRRPLQSCHDPPRVVSPRWGDDEDQ
ncbi:MAG: hypothetical protein U5K74_11550 [Gemmatimonadaceae bacterium]|nr:hypothetical protein [Gemmatimonadaceae bacterium]